MQTKGTEWQWLDPHRSVDQPELARLSGMSEAELEALVEDGSLVPQAGMDQRQPARVFSAACVPPLCEAARLRADFGLDLVTVSLLLRYLQRIAHLELQLRALQPHPPQHQQLPREGPAPWREPHA